MPEREVRHLEILYAGEHLQNAEQCLEMLDLALDRLAEL